MDNNQPEKYPSFSWIWVYFWSENTVFSEKGLSLVAALVTVRPRPIMRLVQGYDEAEVEMRFEAEPPGDNILVG